MLFIGSNPHSKGDIFSRLWYFFLEIIKFTKIKIIESKKNDIHIYINIIIYIKIKYLKFLIGN